MTSPNRRFITLYCGLLMSIGAFSIDISLPAVPAMVADMAAPYATVQWTVTIYMFTGAFGQLIWGPASDRFGRLAMLAAGLATYLAGSLACTFAPGVEWLLAGRALQGFGAASAIVMSRAVIRDLYSGSELARNLALATMFFALGPIIAPFVGVALSAAFGWRAIFAGLSVWAVVLLAMMTALPETLKTPNPKALKPSVYRANAKALITHPQSRRYLAVSAASMAAMLLIIASAPRVYEAAFGLTGMAFASYFAFHGTGIVIGQWANRRMIPRLGVARAAAAGNGVLILSAGLILAVSLAGWLTPLLLTLLLILFATSYLIVYSNAAALVLDPHGRIAGFATAFMGFVSQLGASAVVSALVAFNGGNIIAWAASLLALCLVSMTLIAGWLYRS